MRSIQVVDNTLLLTEIVDKSRMGLNLEKQIYTMV